MSASRSDITRLKLAAQKAVKLATQDTKDRRVPILEARLDIGKFQHELRKIYPDDDKAYGRLLAREIPETGTWDAALRSNNLWLYRAIYVPRSDGNDIRQTLKIDRLEGFRSENPTTIKRNYKKEKAKMATEQVTYQEPEPNSPVSEHTFSGAANTERTECKTTPPKRKRLNHVAK